MIDWWFVGVNALWILGLSIILAAFSYHNWLRRETGQRWKEAFARPWWRIPFSLGMLLFCLGLGLGRGIAWWERALWGVLAVSFAWQLSEAALQARRLGRKRGEAKPGESVQPSKQAHHEEGRP